MGAAIAWRVAEEGASTTRQAPALSACQMRERFAPVGGGNAGDRIKLAPLQASQRKRAEPAGAENCIAPANDSRSNLTEARWPPQRLAVPLPFRVRVGFLA